MRAHPARRNGFTLVEGLIVSLVIAILAMVTIPRIVGATRAAREAALQADLRLLRAAVAAFRIDVGRFPNALEQLIDGSYREKPLPAQANGTPAPPDGYRGPYLTTGDGQLLRDPITGERSWGYDPSTGYVWTDASGPALDGTSYTDW
jgi:prepilin-type N-terminal cleavage/methylation domain-containing protein